MHRSRLLLLTALVLVTTISAYGALQPDKALDKPVTLAVKGEALCDIMPMLEKQTGVRLRVSKEIADQKATIFVDDRPLRQVMGGISTLFGYHWTKKTFSTGDVYELWQDEKSRRESVDKWQMAWSESSKLALGDVRSMLQVAKMSPEEKRTHEAKAEADAANGPDEAKARLTALHEAVANPVYAPCAEVFLNLPAEVYDLLGPGVVMRFHTASKEDGWRLPDDFARAVLALAQPKKGGANPNEVEPGDISLDITLGKSGRSVDLQAALTCYLQPQPGMFTSRGYMVRLADRTLADVMAVGAPLPHSDKNNPAEMQVELTRKDLEAAGAREWQPSGADKLWANRSDMLSLLHDKLGLQIISDHCSRWDVRTPGGKQTVSEMLESYDKVPEVAGMYVSQAVWGWDGDFLYMRAKDPVHATACETPNRQLRKWASVYREHGFLGLDDHAEISLLSEEQDVSLMMSRTFLGLPGEGNLGPDTLRLYGLLTLEQRRKAFGGGLQVSELTAPQIRELVKMAPGSVTSGGISLGDVPASVGVWKDGLRLDKQEIDPRTLPVVIRMRQKTQSPDASNTTGSSVSVSVSGAWASDGTDTGSVSGVTHVGKADAKAASTIEYSMILWFSEDKTIEFLVSLPGPEQKTELAGSGGK